MNSQICNLPIIKTDCIFFTILKIFPFISRLSMTNHLSLSLTVFSNLLLLEFSFYSWYSEVYYNVQRYEFNFNLLYRTVRVHFWYETMFSNSGKHFPAIISSNITSMPFLPYFWDSSHRHIQLVDIIFIYLNFFHIFHFFLSFHQVLNIIFSTIFQVLSYLYTCIHNFWVLSYDSLFLDSHLQ